MGHVAQRCFYRYSRPDDETSASVMRRQYGEGVAPFRLAVQNESGNVRYPPNHNSLMWTNDVTDPSARWASVPYGPNHLNQNTSSGKGGFYYPYVNHVDFERVTVEWSNISNEFGPVQGYVTQGIH